MGRSRLDDFGRMGTSLHRAEVGCPTAFSREGRQRRYSCKAESGIHSADNGLACFINAIFPFVRLQPLDLVTPARAASNAQDFFWAKGFTSQGEFKYCSHQSILMSGFKCDVTLLDDPFRFGNFPIIEGLSSMTKHRQKRGVR